MPDEVESMAYSNAVPWHGLGHQIEGVATPQEMIKLAGLDWSVEKEYLYTHDNQALKKHFALRRQSDGKVLDVVGSQYTPVQNKDIFEFFKEFTEAGKADMETAGSLQGGQYVWALARLNSTFQVSSGDEVGGYILIASPHKQGKALQALFTAVRVVCMNTLTMALQGGSAYRMTHRRTFNPEEAKEAMGVAREQFHDFEVEVKALKKLKLSDNDAMNFIHTFTKRPDYEQDLPDEIVMNPTGSKILDAYHNAPGADVGNGWGLLNAVTYYYDHVSGNSADTRLTNAWLGSAAKRKEEALHMIREM